MVEIKNVCCIEISIKLSWKTSKNDLLQIVSIENPYNSKFYADFNANKSFSFQLLYFKV